MAEISINQPVTVDAKGNISVHGRSALWLPLAFQDSDGEALDVSSWSLKFEVRGVLSRDLLPATDDLTSEYRIVALTQEDVASLGSKGHLFAVVSYTSEYDDVVLPRVYWEGTITVRGFARTPENDEGAI